MLFLTILRRLNDEKECLHCAMIGLLLDELIREAVDRKACLFDHARDITHYVSLADPEVPVYLPDLCKATIYKRIPRLLHTPLAGRQDINRLLSTLISCIGRPSISHLQKLHDDDLINSVSHKVV